LVASVGELGPPPPPPPLPVLPVPPTDVCNMTEDRVQEALRVEGGERATRSVKRT
jgi:hypothetical protein